MWQPTHLAPQKIPSRTCSTYMRNPNLTTKSHSHQCLTGTTPPSMPTKHNSKPYTVKLPRGGIGAISLSLNDTVTHPEPFETFMHACHSWRLILKEPFKPTSYASSGCRQHGRTSWSTMRKGSSTKVSTSIKTIGTPYNSFRPKRATSVAEVG